MSINKVAIIGCGWLGTALALALKKKQVQPLATCQSDEGLTKLTELGISAEKLTLPAPFEQIKDKAVFNCQQLIICITPQIRQGKTDYPEKIAQLVAGAQAGNVKRIIMISSTAIYNDLSGELDESAAINLDNTKVDLLHQAEQALVNFSGDHVILRCSGLVAEDRHPGRFLRHKKPLTNADVPVNLIHQKDVVGILLSLLNSTDIAGVFNLSSRTQASKKTFYRLAAQALGNGTPEFSDEENKEQGKFINSDKIRAQTNYQFCYDDLLTWLEQ